MSKYYGYVYRISIPTKEGIRIYIGQKHSTTDKVISNYYGSGTRINNWFKKYLNKFSYRCPEKFANKFGIKRHVFAWCKTREELNILEKELVSLHLNSSYCWNITAGGWGGSYKGRKKSKEELEKLSKAHKGKKHNYKVWNKGKKNCWSKDIIERVRSKKIGKPNIKLCKKCKNIELNIIYSSLHEAAKSINCKQIATGVNCIARVCRKERNIAYGYHWEFI